jgi:hypothetical protein
VASNGKNASGGILQELLVEFADHLDEPVIRSYLACAITDLHGSISGEALPEMAVRLARVRLTACTTDARPPDDSIGG